MQLFAEYCETNSRSHVLQRPHEFYLLHISARSIRQFAQQSAIGVQAAKDAVENPWLIAHLITALLFRIDNSIGGFHDQPDNIYVKL